MKEGFSDHNSETPDDSTEEADNYLDALTDIAEGFLVKIKSGHGLTETESYEALCLAVNVFEATKDLDVEKWSPGIAAFHHLLEVAADIMAEDDMRNFAEGMQREARTIAGMVSHTENMTAPPPTQGQTPLPRAEVVELPSNSPLRDTPHL